MGRTVVTCRTDDAAAPQTCEFIVEVTCGHKRTLDFTVKEGVILLSWSEAIRGTLQSAPTPLGPWKTIENSRSPFQVNMKEKAEFFRFLTP